MIKNATSKWYVRSQKHNPFYGPKIMYVLMRGGAGDFWQATNFYLGIWGPNISFYLSYEKRA